MVVNGVRRSCDRDAKSESLRLTSGDDAVGWNSSARCSKTVRSFWCRMVIAAATKPARTSSAYAASTYQMLSKFAYASAAPNVRMAPITPPAAVTPATVRLRDLTTSLEAISDAELRLDKNRSNGIRFDFAPKLPHIHS